MGQRERFPFPIVIDPDTYRILGALWRDKAREYGVVALGCANIDDPWQNLFYPRNEPW